MENNFVLLKGGCEEKAELLVEVLLLFQMEVRENGEKEKFSFVQYMKYSPLSDDVHKVHGCVNLQRCADNDTDKTLVRPNRIYEDDSPKVGD